MQKKARSIGAKPVNFYSLLESFVDELIQGGIQKKKPKAIPNVRNGEKRNAQD